MREEADGHAAIGRDDFGRLLTAAFAASVGVMLSLLISALFWPPPGPMAGSHPTIVGSAIDALRIEPREKAFFALAPTLGFIGAGAALLLRWAAIGMHTRSLVLLLPLLALVNICCPYALNEGEGWSMAAAGFCGTLALYACAWKASRRSRRS